MLRRKRREQAVEPPFPEGDPMREIFLALVAYAKRGPRRTMRRVDDVLEFDIKGDAGDFAASLKQVIAHCKRMGIAVPEESVFTVRQTERPAGAEAGEAIKEMREDMRRRGVRDRKHYYTESERPQTGEIDRTYEVDTGNEKEGGE